jgi:C-terminal peptidase prc
MSGSIFSRRWLGTALIQLSLLATGCAHATELPSTTSAVQGMPIQTSIANNTEMEGVRLCPYVPGQSVALPISAEMFHTPAPTPLPTAIPFKSTPVDADTVAKQIALYSKIWNLVNDRYIDRDFNGLDWLATGKHYETLIRQGLSTEDFYRAMNEMIQQLGDNHSHLDSPEQVKEMDLAGMGKANFVGIGGLAGIGEENGEPVMLLVSIFPGSPAEKAGLKPHDTITQIDGGPVLDESGDFRTLGPENTEVVLTVHSPAQPSRRLKLVRQHIEKDLDVEFCLVANTHIGYIAVRNYFNTDYAAQISTAIHKMSAKAPLDGLILDNRSNDGGFGDTEKAILALFTKGEQGKAVGIDGQDVWNITSPVNVDGSQSVPMVVLVDEGSASGGEMIAGMLQNSHRAIVVGKQTRGTTGALELFSIADGSKLYLYTAAFQPAGGEVGQWEKKGITPDVVVPADWNQYREANDPMLAKAVELLLKK